MLWQPTEVPALGLSVFALVTFVGGHVAFSLGAPIALVETLFPRPVPEPWVGRATPVVLGVVTFVVAGIVQGLLPTNWAATTGLIMFGVAALVVCTRLARSPDWSGAHILALASGLVLGSGTAGFSSHRLATYLRWHAGSPHRVHDPYRRSRVDGYRSPHECGERTGTLKMNRRCAAVRRRSPASGVCRPHDLANFPT